MLVVNQRRRSAARRVTGGGGFAGDVDIADWCAPVYLRTSSSTSTSRPSADGRAPTAGAARRKVSGRRGCWKQWRRLGAEHRGGVVVEHGHLGVVSGQLVGANSCAVDETDLVSPSDVGEGLEVAVGRAAGPRDFHVVTFREERLGGLSGSGARPRRRREGRGSGRSRERRGGRTTGSFASHLLVTDPAGSRIQRCLPGCVHRRLRQSCPRTHPVSLAWRPSTSSRVRFAFEDHPRLDPCRRGGSSTSRADGLDQPDGIAHLGARTELIAGTVLVVALTPAGASAHPGRPRRAEAYARCRLRRSAHRPHRPDPRRDLQHPIRLIPWRAGEVLGFAEQPPHLPSGDAIVRSHDERRAGSPLTAPLRSRQPARSTAGR